MDKSEQELALEELARISQEMMQEGEFATREIDVDLSEEEAVEKVSKNNDRDRKLYNGPGLYNTQGLGKG